MILFLEGYDDYMVVGKSWCFRKPKESAGYKLLYQAWVLSKKEGCMMFREMVQLENTMTM